MKIMLLGSNGQLGKELDKKISSAFSVFAFPRSKLDITNEQAVYEAVFHIQPDLIINAAAYTAVDKAESDKERAYDVNAYSVARLAQLVNAKKVWLIHYSTDYVFDGTKLGRYSEKDKTNPINIYGASKLAGESAITETNCQHLIFRTSWVIGKDGNNFAKTILRLAMERDYLRVINDQIGVPTSPSLISRITLDAIYAIQINKAWPQGVYHLAPQGITNWFEIAQTLLAHAEKKKLLLQATANDIQAISTSEYLTAARRPMNSLLKTHKLQSQLSFNLPHWRDDFLITSKNICKDLSVGMT